MQTFKIERCTSKTVINCTAAFYNKNLLLDLISYTNCQDEDDWSDEDKQSHTSGASKSSLTAPSGGRKSPSPAPSANSLFAEEPEDDLFASTKSAAKPTDRSVHLYLLFLKYFFQCRSGGGGVFGESTPGLTGQLFKEISY